MTNITGDVLRAVADWYDRQPGTDVLVSRLRDDATKADVDEKRVEVLSRVYSDAWQAWCGETPVWDEIQDTSWAKAIRAGIRAVLDKIRIDSYTAPCDGTCDDPSPHNAHLTDAGREHYITSRPIEPRQWDRIEDVPNGVIVRDNSGDSWRRNGSVAEFDFGKGRDFTRYRLGNTDDFAPFTEIVDGAQ